jgi:hypothetical protein
MSDTKPGPVTPEIRQKRLRLRVLNERMKQMREELAALNAERQQLRSELPAKETTS